MDKRTKRTASEKALLRKDLYFYLEYFNKVPEQTQQTFDKEIERITARLKELGKK